MGIYLVWQQFFNKFAYDIYSYLLPQVWFLLFPEALTQKNHQLLNERLNYGFRAGMIISLRTVEVVLYVLAYPLYVIYCMGSSGSRFSF